MRVSLSSCLLGVFLFFTSLPGICALPDKVTFGVTIEQGNVETAKQWLAEGLNPDFIGDRIGTGLMIGAWEGNIAMMETFIEYGASISFTNRHNEEALQLAAWRGQKKAVEWLIDHGASINRHDKNWNALHYAAFAGHTGLVQDLIDWGADINMRTPNGSTALMMAVREGHEQIVANLLKEGADPRVINDNGETALVWAMRNKHLKIAKMVSDEVEFARAANLPPATFGRSIRSQMVPDDVASLLKAIEEAELASLPTNELKKRFHAALEKLRNEQKETEPNQPTGMMIRAKKNQPGQEQANLIFEQKNNQPANKKTDKAANGKKQSKKQLPAKTPATSE